MILRPAAGRRKGFARNGVFAARWPDEEENPVGEGLDLAQAARTETGSGAVLRDPRAKLRHLEACLTQPVEYEKTTRLEGFDLANQALPEVSLAELDLSICFGFSAQAARRLIECGVAGLDCSGAGGTSWAKVEAFCAPTPRRRALGLRFGEWGIPTSRSILNVRSVSAEIPLIASGGLRSGIDLAKALALGADLGAMARPFLLRAQEGEAGLHEFIEDVPMDLRVCMFGAGAPNVRALRGALERNA